MGWNTAVPEKSALNGWFQFKWAIGSIQEIKLHFNQITQLKNTTTNNVGIRQSEDDA